MRGLVLCKGACAFVLLVVGLVLIGTAVFLGTYGMGTLVPELERQTVNQVRAGQLLNIRGWVCCFTELSRAYMGAKM